MKITLDILYVNDCPNVEPLRKQIGDLELEDLSIEVNETLITDSNIALFPAFHGSPTVTLGGYDLFFPDRSDSEISCRLYSDPVTRKTGGFPSTEALERAIRSRLKESS
ncbi:MAG: hypothetical protein M0019_02975 [Actinomycetota bacterium]|nr:hypothetical protein [Actinomycetota bacterium]